MFTFNKELKRLPVATTIASADYIYVETGGRVTKMAAGDLVQMLLAALPTTDPAVSGKFYLNTRVVTKTATA